MQFLYCCLVLLLGHNGGNPFSVLKRGFARGGGGGKQLVSGVYLWLTVRYAGFDDHALLICLFQCLVK